MTLAGVLDALLATIGAFLVVTTFASAVRTVVVPRDEPVFITRLVYVVVRSLVYRVAAHVSPTRRERLLGYYAPFAVLVLPFVWLLVTLFGYALIYLPLGINDFRRAVLVSGANITTLGSAIGGQDWPHILLSISEAVIGVVEVALIISFLPAMYAAYSSREKQVAFMAVRAGTPPSALEMLKRSHLIGDDVIDLEEVWDRFEEWFDEISDTHTTFMMLPSYRSAHPERSWITTAGAVLDCAAIVISCLEVEHTPRAQLCLRAGYTSLRSIAASFSIGFDADPRATDPITVTRAEWEQLMDDLEEVGLAVRADRDAAWADFAGWRVNYDVPLVALATFLAAPYAPWSSDRMVTAGSSVITSRFPWRLVWARPEVYPTPERSTETLRGGHNR